MQKRTLGKDLVVSAIGFGCMGLSHANGAPTEEKKAIEIIREAYENGHTFFDAAEIYGFKEDPHHNEKLVGEALKDVRENVVIATKFGVAFDYEKDPDHPELILDSSEASIRKSLEGSLKRLQTDYIDLYYQHRIDPKVEPEVVAGVMKQLIEEGKIKYWGISMANEEYLRRAHAVCPVTCIENVYSMLSHDESLFDTLEELNVGLVSCCPLAKGFLTGKYSKGQKFEKGDYRGYAAWMSDESYDKNQPIIDLLHELAQKHNATLGQISMAWMVCRKPFIVPIPGTRKSERVVENSKASDIVLSSEEVALIDATLEKIER